MRKLVASPWITLDNVYDSSSMPQWFFPFDSESRQNAIRDSVFSSDAILMGRTTYEMLMPYWSRLKDDDMAGVAGRLNHDPKYVVSTSLKAATWENSTIIRTNVVEAIRDLKQQPGHEIRIEGSGTLANFLMKAGLVDELRLLVHPFVIGAGKRYFQEGLPAKGLILISCQQLDKGVLRLVYANH
jgi:dihydrofolate reductase